MLCSRMQSTIAKTKEDMLCGSLNIDTSALMAGPMNPSPAGGASSKLEFFPGSYVASKDPKSFVTNKASLGHQ